MSGLRLSCRTLAEQAPTKELRSWLLLAHDFGARLYVDPDTGFVTLKLGDKSVTKRGLTMFTFDDLPPRNRRTAARTDR